MGIAESRPASAKESAVPAPPKYPDSILKDKYDLHILLERVSDDEPGALEQMKEEYLKYPNRQYEGTPTSDPETLLWAVCCRHRSIEAIEWLAESGGEATDFNVPHICGCTKRPEYPLLTMFKNYPTSQLKRFLKIFLEKRNTCKPLHINVQGICDETVVTNVVNYDVNDANVAEVLELLYGSFGMRPDLLSTHRYEDKDREYRGDGKLVVLQGTALHFAAWQVMPKCVAVMLKYGVDPTVEAKNGLTALGVAYKTNKQPSEEFKDLLEDAARERRKQMQTTAGQ